MSKEKGLRLNGGKLKWSLVPFDALAPMVRVLQFGSKKYAPYNWQKGLSVVECVESLLRHTFAFLDGEDLDPESNEEHIGHIQANILFISWLLENKPEFDDRIKK